MNRRQFLSFSALTALPLLALKHRALAGVNEMTSYSTLPGIQKNELRAWEHSPFVLDGDLYRAGFRRMKGETVGRSITIDKYHPDIDAWQRIANIPFTRYLGCIIVEAGQVFAFATTDTASSPNKIIRREIDPATWTFTGSEIDVRQSSAGTKFYNTSVCKGPDGFIMVCETNEGTPFSIRFLQSTDLLNWTPIGDLCKSTTYAACPTVRYAENGYYIVPYLFDLSGVGNGPWITAMSRTKDFVNIEPFPGNAKYTAYQQLLAPDGDRDGVNTSDFDLAEWDGPNGKVVYFEYLFGNQSGLHASNGGWYEGTIIDLYREFWPKPNIVFGDSNAVGHGVAAAQSWPSILSESTGAAKTVHAVNGHMAADQSWLLYGISPDEEKNYIVSVGTNDAQHYGTGPAKLDAYANFLRAIAVWCAAPLRYTARSGSMTFSGAWSNTAVNSIGKKTTDNGATATKTVNGTAVYIGYLLQNLASSESVFEVSVDGVLKETVTLNGVTVGSTLVGRSYAPAAIRIGGLSDGPHEVEVKSVSGNALFLEWIAGSDQISRPRVTVADVPRRTSAGYASGTNDDANVAAYSASAFAVANELSADGLEVATVDFSAAVNPSVHLQADGTHLNAAGHAAVAAAF